MRLNYARQQFDHAIYRLAVGPGDVRSRLLSAYVNDLSPLVPSDFPEKLQDDYAWVLAQLGKYKATEQERRYFRYGDLEVTLSRIRNNTGARIAERIFLMHRAVLNRRCVCGRLKNPTEVKQIGSRRWIRCHRCHGTIRQLSQATPPAPQSHWVREGLT